MKELHLNNYQVHSLARSFVNMHSVPREIRGGALDYDTCQRFFWYWRALCDCQLPNDNDK